MQMHTDKTLRKGVIWQQDLNVTVANHSNCVILGTDSYVKNSLWKTDPVVNKRMAKISGDTIQIIQSA